MDMTNDIDKYIDIKKNSNVVVSDKSKEKQRKLNRVIKIHTEQPMKIDNEDFKLKLVEMETNIIIEIIKEKTSFCLELER